MRELFTKFGGHAHAAGLTLPESSLEKSERLEQLRFLENGMQIFVGETPYDSVGVDTGEDLQRVIEILRKSKT